jgi:hypothetical protein
MNRVPQRNHRQRLHRGRQYSLHGSTAPHCEARAGARSPLRSAIVLWRPRPSVAARRSDAARSPVRRVRRDAGAQACELVPARAARHRTRAAGGDLVRSSKGAIANTRKYSKRAWSK